MQTAMQWIRENNNTNVTLPLSVVEEGEVAAYQKGYEAAAAFGFATLQKNVLNNLVKEAVDNAQADAIKKFSSEIGRLNERLDAYELLHGFLRNQLEEKIQLLDEAKKVINEVLTINTYFKFTQQGVQARKFAEAA